MKRRKGFTLIELMIVIAIIAILAAVLVPNFMRAREASRYNACKSNLKNLSTAMEMYSSDFDGMYPGGTSGGTITEAGDPSIGTGPNGASAFRASYVGKRTSCPTARSMNYHIIIPSGGVQYTIYCPSAPGGANLNVRHRIGAGTGGPTLDSMRGFIDRT